jgi:hypothetical protein
MNVAGARRERVRLFECWYREPMTVPVVDGGAHHGSIHDGVHPGVKSDLSRGIATLVNRTMMRMRCAIFTEGAMVYDGESPYRHNKFPFTPMWCYRRFRDNMPYGAIRNLRDPQEDFNKRGSKVLFLLSVNRVVADDDAVEDHEEAREEAAKPNAYIKKKKGREFAHPERHAARRGALQDRADEHVADPEDRRRQRRQHGAPDQRAIRRGDQGAAVRGRAAEPRHLRQQAPGDAASGREDPLARRAVHDRAEGGARHRLSRLLSTGRRSTSRSTTPPPARCAS